MDDDQDGRLHLLRALANGQKYKEAPQEAHDQLRDLFQGELPLGPLCDVLSFALPLPAEEKQELLELLDVSVRARRLIEQIDALTPAAIAAGDRKFPPDFSSN